jgi:methionyl-tRNA synthetase
MDRTDFRAAKCDKCGAKLYPQSLLEPHLSRHRRRKRWFNAELRKLQYTFSHMRDIA